MNVRYGTLVRWMKHPDFKALLEIATDFQHVKALFDMLDGLTPEALEALQRVMKEGSPAQVLKAAEDVMRWTQTYTDRHHELVKLADQRSRRRRKL